MIDTLMRHKLMLVILILFVAGAAWYGMMGSSASAPALTSDTLVAGPDQALIETLLALRAVKLDGAILTEPIFLGLQDFSTAIVPEPVGRPNPFASLGASAAASASTTKSAQIFNGGKGAKPPKY